MNKSNDLYDLETARRTASDWVKIQVTYAQDAGLLDDKLPPEQVILIDGVEYRSRSPAVIACLFEGSSTEDTDWSYVATDEWLETVNSAVNSDEDVRFGLLKALGTQFPEIKELHERETSAWARYHQLLNAVVYKT